MTERRGRQHINAINLQLITHQLTPGQLVASEQADNMLNACEPCVYIHDVPPYAPPPPSSARYVPQRTFRSYV